MTVEIEGLAEDASLYDYYFDPAKGVWVLWMETVPEFSIKPGSAYENRKCTMGQHI